MKKFYIRSHPLTDFNKIEANIYEQFEREWKDGSLPAWEKFLKNIRGDQGTDQLNSKLYCIPCKKLFTNEQVMDSHKKGKNHIKKVNQIANTMNNLELFEVKDIPLITK